MIVAEEFSTESELDIIVNPSSLQTARDEVEAVLDEVQIDATLSSSGGVARQSGGRSEQLQSRQLDELGEIQTALEDRADVADEWDLQHDLSRERNELLRELGDELGQSRFDRAASGGGGLAGGLIGLGLAGVVGTIGGFVSKLGDIDLKLPDDLVPLPIEEPPEIPYGGPDPVPVKEPDPVGYTGPDPIPVEDPTGDETPTDDPDPAPTDNPMQNPTTPGDPVEIPEVGFPEVPEISIPEVGVGVAGGALAAGGAKILSEVGGAAPKTAGGGIGFPSPGGIVAGIAGRAEQRERSDRSPIGRLLTDMIGDKIGGAGGATAATGVATAAVSESASRSGEMGSSTTPRIEFSPTYNLDTKEIERQFQSDLDELRRQLDDLERSITGGR